MDHFQDFYQGTGPEVTYCKRFKGDRTKTAAYRQRVVVPPQPHLHGREIVNMELTQPSGSPVRGKPIDARDPSIPERVYHVTTNLPAVRLSEHLRAGGEGGLGGDAKDQVVSMTTDPEIAHHLEHDIKFMAKMHHKHGPDPDVDFNHETKEWEGSNPERGKRIFDDFQEEGKRTGTAIPDIYDDKSIHRTYGLRDYARVFYNERSSVTGKQGRRIRNPLFFGDLSHVNPDHVGVVTIPKKNLAGSGSLITDFDRDNPHGLSEIRAYGDVPLEGAEFGHRTKTAAEGDRYRTVGGDEAEEVHGFTGRVRGGHLENPMDHTMEWHHGSPTSFKRPGEPEDNEDDEEYDPDDRPERHWNTHLGTHWTSLPEVAKKFADGLYEKKRSAKERELEPGFVHTANLGIKNPKVYPSEFDMDKEAHSFGKEHFGEPDEDNDGVEEEKPESLYSDDSHAAWISKHPDVESIAYGFKRKLQAEGHDGIVYGNELEGPHHRDFTGVKPGSNPPMRGHPSAITFDPSQHHNVRSRGANEPDREQLHLFDKFGHIRWVTAAAKLRPFTAPTYQDEDNLRGPSEKATEGGPVTIFGGNSNPQAIAKKKAVHERLYKTLSAKMETDPELKDWADRQVGVEGHDGPKAHGYEHPAHYEGQDDAHVQLGHHIKKAIDDWAGSATSGVDAQAKQLAVQKHFGLPESTMDDVRHRYGEQGQDVQDNVRAHYAEHAPFLHHFIQAVYDDTQAHLKRHGVTHMLLHRGVAAQDAETSPDWMKPPIRSVTKITPEERESHNRGAWYKHEKWGDDQTHKVTYDQKEYEDQVRGGVWSQKTAKVTSNPLSSWTTNKRTANEFADRTYNTNQSMVLSAKVPAERVWSTAHTGPGCLGEREAIVLGGPGEASLTHRGPWPSHATSNPRKFQRLKAKQAHANPLPNIDHGHEDWIKTTDWDMDGHEVAPGNPHMIDHFGHVYLAMSERSDYGMSHSPTEGPPVHNLLGGEGEAAFAPKDIYTHMHYYTDRNEPSDSESMNAIQNARHDGPYGRGLSKRGPKEPVHLPTTGVDIPGHPEETDEEFAARQERRRNGEHFVTVYRAAPKGVKTINHGDWVSLSKSYARSNGVVSDDKTKDQPVYKARVKAKHVRWAGDSLNEFGYFGPEAKTEVHFRGGKNAERVGQPHEGSMRVTLSRTGAEEIIVPRNIDTMRESTCAVCFAPGTLVRAKAGYVPIASISSGEEVLASDGRWHRVLEVMERDYDGMAYWLRSSMMTEPVLVTPEHPIGTLVSHHIQGGPCRPTRCGHPVPNESGRKGNRHHIEWVEVEQLSSSSFVVSRVLEDAVPISVVKVPEQFFPDHGWLVVARQDPRQFELTDDFLWMIGMYLAEGSTGTRKVLFSLHQKEVEYQERLVRLFESYGYHPVVRSGYYEDGQGVQVEVYSSMLSEWFPIWLGHGCQNKTIPAELLNLPLDRLEHVWEGVLDGDGTNGYDQCHQTSEVLALQLVEIALRRGGVPTVSLDRAPGKKLAFKVAGTTRSRLGTRTGRIKKGAWKFLGETLAQVRQVQPTLYAGKVYNLRVEGDPTYVVQNMLVHNCGSTGTMNGDRCTVCSYLATPEAFQTPDLNLAGEIRDQLGIGNPDSELGAVQGAPGAPQGLDGDEGAMGMAGADQEAAGEPGEVPDLICDNCGATFNSQGEEEDLDEPYLSPAARIEPDVSALGVPDEVDVAREVAEQENMTGQNEGVGYQEGGECPTCGEGTLVPSEGGEDDGLGPEGEMEGDEELPGDMGPGAPDEGELAPGEEGAPEGDNGGPLGGTEEGLLPGEVAEQGVDPDDEQVPPGEEGQEEDEEPEEGPGEDDEGNEPPFVRRNPKESSTMAQNQGAQRRQVSPVRPAQPQARSAPAQQVRRPVAAAAPNPAALERKRLFDALNITTAAINRQADLVQRQHGDIKTLVNHLSRAQTKIAELTLRSEGLERQMSVVANASGLAEPLATIGAACQSKVAALYNRRANPANPAQPVTEPGTEPPIATSAEAMQSAGRDDVTQLGASPIADVSADATTSVDTPYGEDANSPVGMTRTDVTAPVAGTEVATPPEMTVIPVDTRIGNPNNPQVAFPFTIGPVGSPAQPYSGPSVGNPPSTAARQPQRPGPRPGPRPAEQGVAVHPGAQLSHDAQSHYIAAVNLARLRGAVGITNEEPFELGIKIANSMNDSQINAEAQGLQAVASRISGQRVADPQPFNPGPAFPPVMASAAAQFQPPYIPEGRVMVPHMASSNGGSVLPTDPSFQAGKYGPGPAANIAATTMFAPRAEEMGWDSPT